MTKTAANTSIALNQLPKEKSSLGLFVLILVILAILLFSTMCYLFWQNRQLAKQITSLTSNQQELQISNISSPTLPQMTSTSTNWKTYTNSVFGYTFQYPNELEKYLGASDDFSHVWINYPGESDMDLFNIDVYSSKLNPEAWWKAGGKTNYNWLFNSAFNQIELSKRTGELTGLKGIQVLGQRKTPGGSTQSTQLFMIPHNQNIYVLMHNPIGRSDIELGYDQIISTLKFIDEDTNQAKWKTYTNEIYRYSVSYPSDWAVDEVGTISQSRDEVRFTPSNFETFHSFSISTNKKHISGNADELTLNKERVINQTLVINSGSTTAKKSVYLSGINDSDYMLSINFEHGGNQFLIKADISNPPNKNELKVFDQIVSNIILFN